MSTWVLIIWQDNLPHFFRVYWAVDLFHIKYNALSFQMSQNVLGQSSLFWARQKTALYLVPLKKNVMPAQKLNLMDIFFWSGTKF